MRALESSFEALDRELERLRPALVSIRRRLHAMPEPSGEEYQTSVFLHSLLRDHGLRVHLGPHGRGVIADPPEPTGLPYLALRADIDALRLQDAKDVPYSSTVPHVMHACGHDAHTAVVCGAALALQAVSGGRPEFRRWRAVFQPEEETGRGALAMLGAGALDGAGGILAAHVDPSRPAGRVGVRAGVLTANCDDFRIVVTGRGGHAARPHESIDPISAATQLVTALYQNLPRSTDSQDPVVITIGRLRAGDSPNVIPEEAEICGTLRTLSPGVRAASVERVRRIAEGLAAMTGAGIGVEFHAGSPSVRNDPDLTELVRLAARDLLGPDKVDEIERPSMGGEDFAHYQGVTPGSLFRLGCAPQTTSPSLHSPEFDVDERALTIGAGILGRAAILWAHQRSD